MSSNALSRRRGFKPRPDVCLTAPNPGRCHPPPPPPPPPAAVCFIHPDHIHLEWDEEEEYEVRVCADYLPDEDPVEITWESTLVGVEPMGPNENCLPDDLIFNFSAVAAGDGIVKCTCTFSDDTVATDTATVTVDEEDEDDD